MVRRVFKIAGIGLGVLVLLVAVLSAAGIVPRGRVLLPVAHKVQYENRAPVSLSPLRSSGNRIVDVQGNPVRLRGLMPPDPARLDSRGLFKRDFYGGIAATGANAVRIAVHPEYWVEDADYLWRHLDPVVGWCAEMGMYVILDWHFIGNIVTGAGEQMNNFEQPPRELTLQFWRLVSAYFRDAPHVIFEIWNEPAGGISAASWQSSATEVVQAIRAEGATQLIIVGGTDYSRNLSWVLDNPIPDDNVAYAAHIYPAHSRGMWDYWFGQASAVYPVLATEWGFMDENRASGPDYLRGDRSGYGEPFLEYLDAHGIGWIACWYDDDWKPPLFGKGWKTPTAYGAFVLEVLETGSFLTGTPTPAAAPNVENKAVEAARIVLAKELDLDTSRITLFALERIIWPDTCLGVPGQGVCESVETPGFRIILTAGANHYTYHTDLTGENIRQETAATSGQ